MLPGRYARVRSQIWQRVTGRWVTITGIALLALLAALATIRVGRQDLAGTRPAPHEDTARQPATARQQQDRAALAAAVRPCRHC
jgi:hypothetical protein